MELGALLWGGGFLSLLVFSYAGNLIFRTWTGRFFSINPGSYILGIHDKGLFPGKPFSVTLKIAMPGFIFPGFSFAFLLDLKWKNREPVRIGFPLDRGVNSKSRIIIPEKRGRYGGDGGLIVFSDMLGFTRSELLLDGSDSVVVYPDLYSRDNDIDLPVKGGEKSPREMRKIRSEEFLDVRKYYPGDDIKRINWKQYAHLNELFLRIGEENPPPESRVCVILDTSLDPTGIPQMNKKSGASYLDSLVSTCGTVIAAFVNKGIEVLLMLPSRAEPVILSDTDPGALLSALSGVWWDDNTGDILLPDADLQTIVFSVPGSSKLPALLSKLGAEGRSASLYYTEPRQSDEFPGGFSIRNLLFVPRVMRRKPYCFDGIRDRLAVDLEKYRGNQTLEDLRAL